MAEVMKDSAGQIAVWLVDDEKAICMSFKEAIQHNASYIHVSTFEGCEDALEALRMGNDPPDIILLDIHMPGMSGIEGIPFFKMLSPGSAIIMLSASFKDEEIATAFSEGAEGYLLKTVQIDQVVDSIRAAMRGGVPLDPLVARKILEMNVSKGPVQTTGLLSEQEKDIVRMLVEGSTLRQISETLSLDFPTVNSALSDVQRKLGVRTRSAVVMKAQRDNLL
jgi:DNA-binding NarL/FixJ family response regulator